MPNENEISDEDFDIRMAEIKAEEEAAKEKARKKVEKPKELVKNETLIEAEAETAEHEIKVREVLKCPDCGGELEEIMLKREEGYTKGYQCVGCGKIFED